MKPQGFADLADLDEDRRIEIIGEAVMQSRTTVAVCVDAIPGKADRYIQKLTERFPGIRIVGRFPGPPNGIDVIQVAPPEIEN